MKLGLVVCVVGITGMASNAVAQCSGTQICGATAGGTNQSAVGSFVGAVQKNAVYSIGDGTVGNTMTITTCQGSCTEPTMAQMAGFFANQSSPVKCPVVLPASLASCTGQLPAGWSSGPVVGATSPFTVTFTYSPAGSSTANLVGSGSQGSGSVSISSNTASAPTLASLLGNKMVCVKNSDVGKTPAGNWYNQEFHAGATGGTITDYKLGSNQADPSKALGSWSITGATNCVLTYNYTDGNINFNYNVWRNGTSYTFCQIAPVIGSPSNFTIPAAQIQGAALAQCN